jgi:iron-sulfur cluster repair protein YtfE (RIC family)
MLRDRSLVPLSHQHHNGLALCVLTERSLRGDASADNIARLARRAVDRYEIELTNHFAIEEEILFPEIERRLGESPLVRELIGEHRKLEKLIEQLRSAPSAQLLEELIALLRAHIRREENELFEEVQRRLPRETLDALGEQIESKVVRVCL